MILELLPNTAILPKRLKVLIPQVLIVDFSRAGELMGNWHHANRLQPHQWFDLYPRIFDRCVRESEIVLTHCDAVENDGRHRGGEMKNASA